MAIRRSRNRRRLLTVLVLVLAAVFIAVMSINIISLKREQHEIKEQRQELEKEKASLEKELGEINDLDNLERQAREQLRLIKPGETLYIFPDEITDPDSPNEDGTDGSVESGTDGSGGADETE